MPLLIFLGEDDFSKHEALTQLKASLGPPEVAESNISDLEGTQTNLNEVIQVTGVVPFLAPGRLAVVRGLLSRFEPRERRRGSRSRRSQSTDLGPWAGLASHVREGLPPTTTLLLVDGQVSRQNPLLSELEPVAEIRWFNRLPRDEVRRWVQERVRDRDAEIAQDAVALLSDLLGDDLWALSQELEKLSLYTRGERAITVADVRLLVAAERETTVFALVDAALEGRSSRALTSLESLLQGGATASYLLGMLGRQVRLALAAQSLLSQQASPDEIGQRLGVRSGFARQKLLQQARQHHGDRLRAFHEALLKADLNIKRGVQDEATALGLLVTGMTSRRGTGAP